MKKVFRILGAICSAFLALVLVYALPYTLATKKINPEIIDSGIDKFFFASLILGCAMCYGFVSYYLFTNLKVEHKPMVWSGFVGFVAFIAGLYYHMIFQSPW